MKKLVGILVTSLVLGGTAVGVGAAILNNDQAEKQAIEVAGVEQARDDNAGKEQQSTDVKQETAKAETTSSDDIGRDKAKEIALQQAGVAEADVTWVKVERDYDDGRLEYNVEFRVGNKEYEYEVDAKTGQVFERDVDVEDDFDDRYDDRYDDDWDDIWDD